MTRRHGIGVGALIMVVLASGCGSAKPKTTLAIAIAGDPDAPAATERFTLRCDPTGGDMPNRSALCKAINARPLAMLFPGRSHSTCSVGFQRPPRVSVTGAYRERQVRFVDEIVCRLPGSISAFPYWAAVKEPEHLGVAFANVQCYSDVPRLAWQRASKPGLLCRSS